MKRPGERCKDTDRRRRDIRAHTSSAGERDINGIDYVEIDETQTVITVYFLGKVPDDVTKANVRIDGGRRATFRSSASLSSSCSRTPETNSVTTRTPLRRRPTSARRGSASPSAATRS